MGFVFFLLLLLLLRRCPRQGSAGWGMGNSHSCERPRKFSKYMTKKRKGKCQSYRGAQVWSHHCLVRDFQAWSFPTEIFFTLLFKWINNWHPWRWAPVWLAAGLPGCCPACPSWSYCKEMSIFCPLLWFCNSFINWIWLKSDEIEAGLPVISPLSSPDKAYMIRI